MKTRQTALIGTAATSRATAVAPVLSSPAQAANCVVVEQEEMAPNWYLKCLEDQLLNAPVILSFTPKALKILGQGSMSMKAAMLMQEHIHQASEQEGEAERHRLIDRIKEEINDHPGLFTGKWFGREVALDALATIQNRSDSLRHLDAALQSLLTVLDFWGKTSHLVEHALVEGQQLASDIRKSLRGPGHTHVMDCTTARNLAIKLFGPESEKLSNYGALSAGEKLYELLADSTQQADLVREMKRAIA